MSQLIKQHHMGENQSELHPCDAVVSVTLSLVLAV